MNYATLLQRLRSNFAKQLAKRNKLAPLSKQDAMEDYTAAESKTVIELLDESVYKDCPFPHTPPVPLMIPTYPVPLTGPSDIPPNTSPSIPRGIEVTWGTGTNPEFLKANSTCKS